MMPSPKPLQSVVISNFPQVVQELNWYDLSIPVLVSVVLAGRDFYVTLTPNNPSYSHAQVTGAIVRALRDLTAANFVAETILDGLDVTTHRSGKGTILVVRGDRNTGNPNANPASHRSRGPNTPQLFPNSWQPSLPFPKGTIKSRHPDALVLLFYINPKTKMIKLELSDPHSVVKVGKRWQFRGWRKRIIVPISPALPGQVLTSNNSSGRPQPSAGWTAPADSGNIIMDKTADAS